MGGLLGGFGLGWPRVARALRMELVGEWAFEEDGVELPMNGNAAMSEDACMCCSVVCQGRQFTKNCQGRGGAVAFSMRRRGPGDAGCARARVGNAASSMTPDIMLQC